MHRAWSVGAVLLFTACSGPDSGRVTAVPPVATFEATPDAVALGETILVDASASRDPDGKIVSYAWDFDDGTTRTLFDPVVTHLYDKPGRYTIQLEITDASGLADHAFHHVSVTDESEPPLPPPPVMPPPPPPPPGSMEIVTQPEDVSVDPGQPVTLTVVATSPTPILYQWRKDGVEVPGETSSTLEITVAAETHEGSYRCVLRDTSGTLVTRTTRVSVNDPPRFVLHPASQTSAFGRPVTLFAAAVGTPTPRFTWQKDGVDIPGANGAELAIATATPMDAGDYQALAENSAGNARSQVATLTVTAEPMPPPPPPASPPTLAPIPPLQADLGRPFSVSITAYGDQPITLTVQGLPPSGNLAFDGMTTISGTAALPDLGDHDVTVYAQNSVGTATATFTLSVRGTAPQITSTPPAVARIDTPYAHHIVATGNPAPTLSVSGLPATFSFDGTADITGTATTADLGQHQVVITASSPTGTSSQTFSLEVLTKLLHYENFSGAALPAAWSATGEWEFGVPPVGGGAVAATDLDGNYADNRESDLDTQPFDLRGLAQPTLQMLHYYDTEAEWDGGRLAISVDGGATYTTIDAAAFLSGGYDSTIRSNASSRIAGQRAWAGRTSNYVEARVDLAAAAGAGAALDDVRIRFEFSSDQSVNRSGWSIAYIRVGDRADLP